MKPSDRQPHLGNAGLAGITALARSTWVSRLRTRRSFRPRKLSRRLIRASSSAERPRNPAASPTFQPRPCNFSRLLARIVILPKTSPAGINHRLRRLLTLLSKDLGNNDRVPVDPINDAPGKTGIVEAQFMAPWPHGWHRPAVGQRDRIASLETAQEITHFKPGLAPKWRRLDLAVKPNQWLVFRAHRAHDMSASTYCQSMLVNLTLRCSKQRLLARRPRLQAARQLCVVADRNR